MKSTKKNVGYQKGTAPIFVAIIVFDVLIFLALFWYFVIRQETPEEPSPTPAAEFQVEDINLQTEVLATIPPDVEMRWFWFSEDGKRVAYLGKKLGREFISINGVDGPYYDRLSPYYGSVVFTRDAASYVAEKDGKKYVVLNGDEQGPYENVRGGPILSADGKQFAYSAYRDGKYFVVLNGKEDPKLFELIPPPGSGFSFFFSPDGSKTAYKGYQNNQIFWIVNGKRFGPYSCCRYGPSQEGIQWSPRGDRFAFFAEDPKETEETGKLIVNVDGKEEGPYDYTDHQVKFISDGKRVSYLAQENGKWYAIVDGKKMSKGHDSMCCLTFSDDGKEVAYQVGLAPWGSRVAEKLQVVWGEKESRGYTDIYSLAFRPGTSELIFFATDDRKQFLVRDLEEEILVAETEEENQWISDVVFSPDGERMAYAFVEAEQVGEGWPLSYTMVLDGRKGKTYDEIRSPVFSRDGKHFAYKARLGEKVFVVLDGKELENYDAVPEYITWGVMAVSLQHLRFTPDGRYLVHGAKKGADLLWVVTEVGTPH